MGDHGQSRPTGPDCMLVKIDRCIEQGHHLVTDEFIDQTAFGLNDPGHRGEKGTQQFADLLGLKLLRFGREAPDITEHHGNLAGFATQCQAFRMLGHFAQQLRG